MEKAAEPRVARCGQVRLPLLELIEVGIDTVLGTLSDPAVDQVVLCLLKRIFLGAGYDDGLAVLIEDVGAEIDGLEAEAHRLCKSSGSGAVHIVRLVVMQSIVRWQEAR